VELRRSLATMCRARAAMNYFLDLVVVPRRIGRNGNAGSRLNGQISLSFQAQDVGNKILSIAALNYEIRHRAV
jgi:hypothetical protein